VVEKGVEKSSSPGEACSNPTTNPVGVETWMRVRGSRQTLSRSLYIFHAARFALPIDHFTNEQAWFGVQREHMVTLGSITAGFTSIDRFPQNTVLTFLFTF